MGVFYEQGEIINRTSKPLNCRFDGQDMVLEPNYTPEGVLIEDVHNMIPLVAAPYAKSQNVRMGSEDPLDPSDYEVLVGMKSKRGQKQVDEIGFLEQSQELTRVRLEEYLDDPTLKITVGGRRVKASDARAQLSTGVSGNVVDSRVR